MKILKNIYLNFSKLKSNLDQTTDLLTESLSSSFYITPPSSSSRNHQMSQLHSKPVFVALTNDSLFFYGQAPLTVDDWFSPDQAYSLLITRVVSISNLSQHSRTGSLKSIQDNPPTGHSFLTRHGTVQGTITHLFQCLTKTELKRWMTLIENQTNAAVNMIKHAEFCKNEFIHFFLEIKLNFFNNIQMFICVACLWNSRTCRLQIHYEYGLKLYDISEGSGLMWQYSYEKLRRSADNNLSLLWLDFEDEEGQMVNYNSFNHCLL